jgi:hypothetical protein
MNGEWCYFKSRLTKEQCGFVLEEGLKIAPSKATMGRDGNIQDDQYLIDINTS